MLQDRLEGPAGMSDWDEESLWSSRPGPWEATLGQDSDSGWLDRMSGGSQTESEKVGDWKGPRGSTRVCTNVVSTQDRCQEPRHTCPRPSPSDTQTHGEWGLHSRSGKHVSRRLEGSKCFEQMLRDCFEGRPGAPSALDGALGASFWGR